MTTTEKTPDSVHNVTVTTHCLPDGTGLVPDVTFTCSEPDTACHIYPACGCEEWDDFHGQDHGPGHERVHHADCWLAGWFENGAICYDGEDSDDSGDYCLPAGTQRSGPVKTRFCQDHIEWEFSA